jgi:hypothetical protein
MRRRNWRSGCRPKPPPILVSGALRVKDIADMIKLVEEARAKITKTGAHTDQFIIALDNALHDQRPGKVSKVKRTAQTRASGRSEGQIQWIDHS